MNHFEPKPITPEYLLKIGFNQMNQITYRTIVTPGVFNGIVLHVEIEPNCIVVSMTIANCDKWTILPIETEQHLNKLINALHGK